MIEPLLLAKSKKEWFYIIFTFIIICSLNTSYLFYKYKNFSKEELYTTQANIINVYKKQDYNVLKISNNSITFFTSTNNLTLEQNNKIQITILSSKITFIEYLKGFYVNSFNIHLISKETNTLNTFINTQHQNINISSIYNAIFLAIPLNKQIQEKIASLGISHLIAISGFHIGILTFLLYFFLSLLYKNIHQKYCPYRNKRFDILIITSIIIFFYMSYLGNLASLLRAFVMYIFAIFLLRANIKLFSFSTLFLIFLFIISIFPKLLFSLSLWFSIAGVFYIFLFIQYFKNMNKILAFLLFNVWIYLAMNPITHYFFDITSYAQLYSPILSLAFTVFYPLELFLHFINYGHILDEYLSILLNLNYEIYYINTHINVFYTYIIISLLSIKYKLFFILLNTFFILFNLYLYLPELLDIRL